MNNIEENLMEKPEYLHMYTVEKKLWWYIGLREVLHYFIEKTHLKNPKILDAGCGTGMNIKFLQSLGYDVEGIDLSSEAVELSKKRAIKQVKPGSITDLDFPNKSFDIILNLDVLGLLDDELITKAIHEFYRTLKPDGYLFLHCAALEWLRSQHDEVSNVKKRFSETELQSYFDKTQWKIVKSSYRMFFLFIPLVFIKIIKKIYRSRSKKANTDLKMPSIFLNSVLSLIQQLENFLLRFVDFPFGTSLFLILKKR